MLAAVSEALDGVVFAIFIGSAPAPDTTVLVNACLHVFVVWHVLHQQIRHPLATLLGLGTAAMLITPAPVR